MAVIVRAYSEQDGQIARASSVNRVVDDLYTLQNGNINSANIADSGVAENNYATSSIQARALDNTSVLTSKVNSEAITLDKVAYEVLLAGEVFG